MPIRLPVVLSPSRTELSARCHRRHVLSDIADRHKGRKPSADFGTVMHAGVGAWWLGLANGDTAPQRFDAAMTAVESEWQRLQPAGSKHSLEMARELMRYYTENMPLAAQLAGPWVPHEDSEGLVMERRVETQLGRYVLSWKLDRLLRNEKTGQLALIDLKTSTQLNQRWHRQFDLWLQGRLYKLAVQQRFDKAPLVLVEGLQKSVPATHAYHLCREWDEEELAEAQRTFELWAARDEKLLAKALERASQRALQDELHTGAELEELWREELEQLAVTATEYNYGDCFAYNVQCPYYELCSMPPAERYGRLQADYEIIADDESY